MELEATASLFSHSNFFSIDDLLEFSNDDIGGSIPDTDTTLKYSFLDTVHDYTKYSPVTEADSEILQFSTLGNEEIGLEWLSNLAEETCGGGANSSSTATGNEKERLQESNPAPDNKQQPASLTMAVPCRARTKRSRVHVWPAKTESSNMQTQGDTWWDWEIPYNEGFNTDTTPSEEVGECLKKVKKSKRKGRESGGQPRRCTHCQTQKTPQWRQGPLGPKSLCNACGVRFKSGRLYPEYRPAKSPTFVSYRHSNSHKKVLEMRGTYQYQYQYQYHQQHHQQGQLRLPASASASSTATE